MFAPKEDFVLTDLWLCRFAGASGARLGLVSAGQVYDLTALGRPQFASMQAWLVAACGRAPQALAELAAVPASARPLCTLDALLDPNTPPALLRPLDAQEVWACGVTYQMSRAARMRESEEPTIYGKVYDAPRPEIFFKATPHRVVGPGEAVGIRSDARWNVPEPELTLMVTPQCEIVGYTVGNDMSSRDLEGMNPLYLPQAKVYDRCCALGPLVRLATEDFDPLSLPVRCVITRAGQEAFVGATNTNLIHRQLPELVSWLGRCNSFPAGIFVLTGTGIVPPDTFSLREGDVITITFEGLGTLENPVVELQA
jgi:2-dehydro-3-deoxy-D-arabinonate dehydratase